MKPYLFGLLAFAATAATAPAAAHGQTSVRFSVAGALALPVGALGDESNVGLNLALRGESARAKEWGFRGDLSYDRFGGRGRVDAFSYWGLGANLLHRERGRVYEFGGLGLYNQRVAFSRFDVVDDTNLGIQGGIGVLFPSKDLTTFLEFGITNVFTPGSNSSWFPVRFGVRF